MFVCSDEETAQRARMVWSFGETRTPSEERDYHAYALGWMYRMNDLTAAFGRAQLGRLDGYLATQRRHARILLEGLAGVEGLILPVEPPGYGHNWYNFTCRIDMEALERSDDPARLRDAVMKALQAEGVGVGVWQRYVLPAMTVFQARNAYGKGSPWSTTGNDDVRYDPALFPIAQRHSDTHFGLTFPLREPNTDEAASLIVEAYRKVFEHARELEVDCVEG
jgi:dTDP-4-amino-4,6-dideoxygalactose transaminase